MKKIILSFFVLTLFISSCKKDKDKDKDPYAGEFAFKSTLILASKTQYMNVNFGSLAFSDRKYIWQIEKAVDDKYYIISADMPGNVLGSNAAGAPAFVLKSTMADDTQLFKFVPSGDNDSVFYIRLVANPNKYISLQTIFTGVLLLPKDNPCGGAGNCYVQKFTLEK